ncbi:MAG TPA: hypothetical protein VIL74_05095 [Pyrinomonadaceae bacterium]
MEVSAEAAARRPESAVSTAGNDASENRWERRLCVFGVAGTLSAATSLFWYA